MDIYDTGLLGTTARSGTNTPDPSNPAAGKTELDQNVEKMVGNISNWWSGIAKKSQDSINQARQQVESQGGIVNYAKSNYSKMESSFADAQKRAREQSSGEPAPETDTPTASIDKGKQRALDEPQETNAYGPTLGSSVSSLFSKLTADPRLQQLQKSLTSSLQSVSNPQQPQLNEDGTPRAPVSGGPMNIQDSLAKLSLTFQSHLPHLDLKESQQLATRYLHATENLAKEIQTDMTELVGELVRIVPPEGESTDKAGEQVTGLRDPSMETVNPNTAASKVSAATEEEDFVWDEEEEEATLAASKVDVSPTAAQAEARVKEKAVEKAPVAEEDEDSDWE